MVKYSKEYKLDAVRFSDYLGVAYTAGWLGIPYYTLKDWRKQFKKFGDQAFVGRGKKHQNENKANQLKIQQLEAENFNLKQELETVREALAILAKNSRK